MKPFGPTTYGALLGVFVSCFIPGISARNVIVEILYYLLPVLIGVVGGMGVEVIARKNRNEGH